MTERPNTVAGLLEKRREIAGQIEHHQRMLNDLIIDLDQFKCRPARVGKKPGPKTVQVARHIRSKPKPAPKGCK